MKPLESAQMNFVTAYHGSEWAALASHLPSIRYTVDHK